VDILSHADIFLKELCGSYVVKMVTIYPRDILNQHRLTLVLGVQVTEVLLSCLRTDYTLDQELQERIQSKPTNSERVGALLDILERRGPNAVDRFIFALIQTDHDIMARKLNLDAANLYIDTRDRTRNQDNLHRFVPGENVETEIWRGPYAQCSA